MDKRKRIVAAAEQSFQLYGYKGTTMDQVAKLADVAKGTIYTFFKNKEDLFDEILENLIGTLKRKAEAAIDPSDTFFNNLHRAIYDILAFRKQHQLTLKLSQEVRDIGTGKAQAALDKVERAILAFIERHIVKAIEKGEIIPCDPRKTAFIMLKIYIALVFEWEEKNEQSLSEEEIADLFDQFIVLGLKPRNATP